MMPCLLSKAKKYKMIPACMDLLPTCLNLHWPDLSMKGHMQNLMPMPLIHPFNSIQAAVLQKGN